MAGFTTFGLLGFHLTTHNVVPVPAVLVLYAGAMAADAIAAVVTGYAYDRLGLPVAAALPVLVAAVPLLAFSNAAPVAAAGVMVWGAAMGIQESTMRAIVADLVPATRRASAFGLFAAVYGGAWACGATIIGVLYQSSWPGTVGFVATTQVAALAVLATVTPHRHPN